MTTKYIDFNDICAWRWKLVEIFEKAIGETKHIEDMYSIPSNELWEYFPFPTYNVIEIDEDEKGNKLEEGLINTSVEIDDSVLEPNKELFNQFLSESIVEIIGGAHELRKGLISALNDKIREEEGEVTYVVYSCYKGKARPATLLFLGSNLYSGNVIFVDNIFELRDGAVLSVEELNKIIENG